MQNDNITQDAITLIQDAMETADQMHGYSSHEIMIGLQRLYPHVAETRLEAAILAAERVALTGGPILATA